jgi:aminoglycoside phosphotransferase (APT) family kinase protein
VLKVADPQALGREIAALRTLAGLGLAPDLVAQAPGVLVTRRLPGAARPAADMGPEHLRALGRTVRRAHERRRTASGGVPAWPRPAGTLEAYRRLRGLDALTLARRDERVVAERVVAQLAPLAPAARPAFRLLHGDLWSGNVVWQGGTPRLADWEFWRSGDPAEDLAYLVEMDGLDAVRMAALLAGYGDPAMGPRLEAWRPLVALDAGLWYLRHGARHRGEALLARAALLADAPGELVSAR